jgi:alpha-1,2-mannosyltransferase
VLARLLGIGTTTTLLWLPLAVAAVAAGLLWGRKLHRAGHDLAGATTVAVAGLLASPFSWSHHWVWIIPTLALAWEGAHRSPSLGRRVLPLLVAAMFAAWWIARPGIPGGSPEGLLWLVPGKHSVERHWSLAQTLLGDLYVELAVAAACAAGLLGAVRGRGDRPWRAPSRTPDRQ